MDQPPKLLDRLPQLPPRPSSKSIPAQGRNSKAPPSSGGTEEAAKKRLTARLEAMGAAALEPPAMDPRTAAVAALMVANFANEAAVRKHFEPLIAAKLFDGDALEDLPVAARFVLRILPKLGPELDEREGIPTATLLAQVKATKEDMLRIAERYLRDIDEAHGRIVTVRLGEGSADDVHDLRMLADLWRDYAETLQREGGASYHVEAEWEARELASHLELALLGPLSEEDQEWRSYLHRALAMLVPLHDEVCRAGRFLFHHDKPEARFPTLASVARVRRRLKKDIARRSESQPARSMTPPSVRPPSVSPEISLSDVSAVDEGALAQAMEGVPTRPPSVAAMPSVVATLRPASTSSFRAVGTTTAPPAAATTWTRPPGSLPPTPGTFSTHPPSSVPPSGGTSSRPPSSATLAAAMPGLPLSLRPILSVQVVSGAGEEPAASATPTMVVAHSFDPVEVVRLDFSPTASAGEDADADMDTADVDLELSYVSESNFYSDISGQEIGLFIATFVVKPPGTPLGVLLSFPQIDEPIFVSGTVRWVREFSPSIEAPPGMGIALKPLAAKNQRAVDQFMKVRPPILHDD